jgi:transcription elongation factor S-II
LAHSQETKVGVAVSKQRSNPDKEISELAKTIVKKWKSAVRPADEAKGAPAPALSFPSSVGDPPSCILFASQAPSLRHLV